jgi:N-acetyltransferase 10
MALTILDAINAGDGHKDQDSNRGTAKHLLLSHHLTSTNQPVSLTSDLTATELNMLMTPFDLKRLESYANNAIDFHVVLDLLPTVASLYFNRRLGGDVRLSVVQSSILLALGLQRKTVEEVQVSYITGLLQKYLLISNVRFISQAELDLPVNQALAQFSKLIRKVTKQLQEIQRSAISATVPHETTVVERKLVTNAASGGATSDWRPMEQTIDDELREAGDEVTGKMREVQREMVDALDLSKCVVLPISFKFAYPNHRDWPFNDSSFVGTQSTMPKWTGTPRKRK